jgi:hypothetical protein
VLFRSGELGNGRQVGEVLETLISE